MSDAHSTPPAGSSEDEQRLSELRSTIDRIDLEVLALLNRRAEAAAEIGVIKQGAVYRPEREAQVLRKVQAANAGPLSNETVSFLFREVMSACLALEQPVSVAYLGPPGTYSEQAAVRQFGHAARAQPFASLEEVFHQVEAGHVQYAVVPVENSLGGSVSGTMDLLLSTPLRICGELNLRIRQQLMAKGPVESLSRVQRVYSHSQSLSQCQQWLTAHLPAAERIPVASNADAASRAAADPDSAAIAGVLAAERYGLTLLARDIEDSTDNTTRFLVLGSQDVGPSGRDRTSLVVSTSNRPGAIHRLLAPLASHGVSMSRLESRPSRTGLWEYVFFVDLEGHAADPRVAQALAEMRADASFLKVLGSYPVAPL
ncbi:MAG: prephenate dehydratase [Pseudomonadota bacterium]|nr:prephenate dehydratase [Pseudomonadota bacterium]